MSRTHDRRTTRRVSRLHLEYLECRDLPAFVTPPVYPASTNPTAMVAGDFNGDGLQDVVVTNQTTPGTVSLLLNTGGALGTPRSFPAGGLSTNSVATADFNGDGRLDLAVTNSITGVVSILRGSGTGLFRRPISYAAGSSPTSVTVADFNGDSILDLAVANQVAAGKITVLLGTGGGVFQPGVIYAAGNTPRSIAAADFDNDNVPDLAVANSGDGTFGILLGRGNGTFEPMSAYAIGGDPYGVAAADFNNDGNVDVVTAHHAEQSAIGVQLGNGDGSFQSPANYAGVGSFAVTMGLSDVTGDGRLDVITAGEGWSAVSFLPGTGTGVMPFEQARHLTAGTGAADVVVADFDDDGKLDFAVTTTSGAGVAVMLAGNGTYSAIVDYPILEGQFDIGVVAGDFNNDAAIDLVTPDGGTNTVSIRYGNGLGAFGPAVSVNVGGDAREAAVGDFNNDGNLDLVVGLSSCGINVVLGNGDGTFQSPFNAVCNYAAAVGVVVTDFNDDGNADVAIGHFQHPSFEVFLGNGDGTFQPVINNNGPPSGFAAGDFNGDGHTDLILTGKPKGFSAVSLVLGNGDGTFQSVIGIDTGPSNEWSGEATVGDFNADGKLDLATANGRNGNGITGSVSVLLGNGNGTFTPYVQYPVGFSAHDVVAADFDGDGKLDLATTNYDDWTSVLNNCSVSVLRGRGDGTFEPALIYAGTPRGEFLIAEDFNGDSLPDLAVQDRPWVSHIAVHINSGDWPLLPIDDGGGAYDTLVSMKPPTMSPLSTSDGASMQLRELKAPPISDAVTNSAAPKCVSPRILTRLPSATHVFVWTSPDDWLASAFGVGE